MGEAPLYRLSLADDRVGHPPLRKSSWASREQTCAAQASDFPILLNHVVREASAAGSLLANHAPGEEETVRNHPLVPEEARAVCPPSLCAPGLCFWVQGFGFRVSGLRGWGSRFGVWSAGFGICSLGFRDQGLGITFARRVRLATGGARSTRRESRRAGLAA